MLPACPPWQPAQGWTKRIKNMIDVDAVEILLIEDNHGFASQAAARL